MGTLERRGRSPRHDRHPPDPAGRSGETGPHGGHRRSREPRGPRAAQWAAIEKGRSPHAPSRRGFLGISALPGLWSAVRPRRRRGLRPPLRSPTLFEDVTKVLATTNTTWSGTLSMVREAVELSGTGTFPAPSAPRWERRSPRPRALGLSRRLPRGPRERSPTGSWTSAPGSGGGYHRRSRADPARPRPRPVCGRTRADAPGAVRPHRRRHRIPFVRPTGPLPAREKPSRIRSCWCV